MSDCDVFWALFLLIVSDDLTGIALIHPPFIWVDERLRSLDLIFESDMNGGSGEEDLICNSLCDAKLKFCMAVQITHPQYQKERLADWASSRRDLVAKSSMFEVRSVTSASISSIQVFERLAD
jgi:hypothetical protein